MLDPEWFIDSFDPGVLTETASSWRTAGERADEHTDTLISRVYSEIDGGGGAEWTGAAAEKARSLYDKFAQRMQAASDEAGLMAELLEGAAEGWQEAQSTARDTITALQNDGLSHVFNGQGEDVTINVFSSTVEGDQGTHRPQSPGAEADYTDAIDEWERAYGKEYHSTCKGYSTALTDAVIDAIEIDEDLSVVLKEGFLSDDPDNPTFHTDVPLDPEQAAGLPDEDASTEEVNDWWEGLSEEDQQYFIDKHPEEIGDLDGVPVAARDEANRTYMDTRLDEIDEELADASGDERAKLEEEKDYLESVRTAANDDSDGQQRYVIDIDAEVKQAAVSVGNPDTADNTAVYVPGTDSSDNPGFQVERAATINNAAGQAGGGETATVMWMGYDDPEAGLQLGESERAVEGANNLNTFMDTMDSTHQSGGARTTVIGHSYGSTVVGTADAQGDGLGADEVILVGSPGAGHESNDGDWDDTVTHADEMNTDNDHVWVASADDDPITYTGVTGYHGADPANEDFGGRRITVDTSGHTAYWDEGSKSLQNQAYIITGQYEAVGESESRGNNRDPVWW